MSNDAKVPAVTLPFELFSLSDLQTLALHATLKRNGVEDTDEFLKKNTVNYRSAFNGGVGCSVVILQITPKENDGKS